jgi:hypothetical protein
VHQLPEGVEVMTKPEALQILKEYRMELNTALGDIDGIPVVLEALDVAIEEMGTDLCEKGKA